MPSSFAKRNLFPKRWEDKKLSMNLGALVPFFHQEVYPGDFWKLWTFLSVKLADFGQPVFDSLSLKVWYFFVPYRTVIEDLEQFITGWSLKLKGPSDVAWPFVVAKANTDPNWAIGSLADYLECPVQEPGLAGCDVAADPFRIYQKICNDWFISEFLQDQIVFSTESGEDTETDLTLKNRCWPRDYFTQALPFTQLGTPVMIPLLGAGGSQNYAPVVGNGNVVGFTTDGTDEGLLRCVLAPNVGAFTQILTQSLPVPVGTPGADPSLALGKGVGVVRDGSKSGLVADLSAVPAFSVQTARLSFQLQRIQERLARSGVRLTEYIRSVFAVFPPDARLDRAEYLGGGTCPILISEVVQNSATTEGSTQGNRTALGDAYNTIPVITKAFTEHGRIMGLMCSLPTPTYYQGIRRDMFGHRTRFDLLQPELAHIGEQPLYNIELFVTGTDKDFEEFGYIPQYQWFREFRSTVCGDFRTNMRNFFFGREFTETPKLNEDFVVARPSTAPFAAGAKNATRPVWVDVLVRADIVRCLPRKGTPGLVDH